MPVTLLSRMLDKIVAHKRLAPTADNFSDAGGTPTLSTIHGNIKAAIWPTNSSPADDFWRKDFKGDYVVCTDQDLGVLPEDVIVHGDLTYVVIGAQLFSNMNVVNFPVYVIDTQLRTI